MDICFVYDELKLHCRVNPVCIFRKIVKQIYAKLSVCSANFYWNNNLLLLDSPLTKQITSIKASVIIQIKEIVERNISNCYMIKVIIKNATSDTVLNRYYSINSSCTGKSLRETIECEIGKSVVIDLFNDTDLVNNDHNTIFALIL
jgi:hypothetical protein